LQFKFFREPGNTLKYIEKLFKKKGLSLDGAFDIQMPNNYITGSNPSSPEEATTLLEAQVPKISDICTRIAGQEKRAAAGDGRLKTAFIHPLFTAFAAKQQGKKFFTSGKCNSCGICEKLCTVWYLRVTSMKPRRASSGLCSVETPRTSSQQHTLGPTTTCRTKTSSLPNVTTPSLGWSQVHPYNAKNERKEL
jgi:hypothetical protein